MPMHSLRLPVITEKTLSLATKNNAYTFEVERSATKDQIKATVEKLYNVEVTSVNTIVGHSSKKATGKRRLMRVQAKIKKAVVTLKAGQKIEIFDVQGGAA